MLMQCFSFRRGNLRRLTLLAGCLAVSPHSTNLALPLPSWWLAATNVFDGHGTFRWTNRIDPNQPERFYLLRLPCSLC